MSLSELEVYHVKDIYNIISKDFDTTRAYLWKSIREFINNLPTSSYVLEAGNGNGKHNIRNDIMFQGLDISWGMCEISKKKGWDILCANTLLLPFRDECFDHTMSVAVLHHLDSENKYMQCIRELLRVTQIGGFVFIQVWAYHEDLIQKKGDKIKKIDGHNNYLMEWPLNGKKYYRFYHLFEKKECLDMLNKIENIHIETFIEEHQNWIIILKKKINK